MLNISSFYCIELLWLCVDFQTVGLSVNCSPTTLDAYCIQTIWVLILHYCSSTFCSFGDDNKYSIQDESYKMDELWIGTVISCILFVNFLLQIKLDLNHFPMDKSLPSNWPNRYIFRFFPFCWLTSQHRRWMQKAETTENLLIHLVVIRQMEINHSRN